MLSHSSSRARSVSRHVEEMAQVRDEHADEAYSAC
jgi:hypothetical protein